MDYFNLFKTILTACECTEFFSTFWLAFMLKIKDIPVEGAAGTTPPHHTIREANKSETK